MKGAVRVNFTHFSRGRRFERKARYAFTLIEILVLVAVVLVLAGMLMPKMTGGKAKAGRIQCVSNLKNVGLGFRIYATDHSDQFPAALLASNGVNLTSIDILDIFRSLTNELSSPKILYCPDDKKRKPAESFHNFTAKNSSYFASLTASESQPQSFLAGDRNIQANGALLSGTVSLATNLPVSWSKDLHNEQGNIAMGDGSVQQMSSSRLRQSIPDQDIATNYLVFP